MGGFGINLNTTGMNLGAGINVQTTVAQIIQADSAPLTAMQNQQTSFTSQTSALTNLNTLLSTLQTSVQALQDPLGQLTARAVTSSNSSVVTASAANGTALANHTITVSNLATTSTEYTNPLTDGNTAFQQGQFTLQVGSNTPVTITVDGTNNTLNGLAAAINSQKDGVTASVITDANGARLSLVSNTSGQPGNLSITNNTTGLTFNQAAGTNANLVVDGVPISSASNTVAGVIQGVTLNLVGTSASQVNVSVAPDATQATAAVNSFVSAYNAVVQAMNTQFTLTTSTDSSGNTATTQPPLFSDNTLAQMQQTLYTDINYATSGNNGLNSLASLGINTQNDGTLSVDSSTLSSALSTNFSSVQAFFQQVGSTNGFAGNFANDLQTLTDPSRGALYVDLQGISQSSSALTQQISDFQANLAVQQQQLTLQFSRVNATLQELPLTLAQITGQLSGLSSSGVA